MVAGRPAANRGPRLRTFHPIFLTVFGLEDWLDAKQLYVQVVTDLVADLTAVPHQIKSWPNLEKKIKAYTD